MYVCVDVCECMVLCVLVVCLFFVFFCYYAMGYGLKH